MTTKSDIRNAGTATQALQRRHCNAGTATQALQRRHCISWDSWNQISATEMVPTFRAAMKGTELNDATAFAAVFCPSMPPPRFPTFLGPKVITRVPKPKKRKRYRRGELPPPETNPTST